MQVLRCLRVDRVTVAVTHFVAAALGPDFVQPPVLEYADVLRQSNERTPILFVLSPGADPAFDIFRLGAHSWLLPPTVHIALIPAYFSTRGNNGFYTC